MAKKILVVDGSEAILQSIRYVLEQEGYQVCIATDLKNGLKKIEGIKTELAIVEYSQTTDDGKGILDAFKKEGAFRLPVLVLVPESQNLLLQNEKNDGADGWILKPFSADALIQAVKRVMDSR
jgi:two-component system chemotaxis response regulator CheY